MQYLDPYLWEGRALDWDAALSATIPKVIDAKNDDDEIAAIGSLLDALHDPLTRVESPQPPPSGAGTDGASSVTWATPDVLVLKLVDVFLLHSQLSELRDRIHLAKAVVLDLRARDGEAAWPLNSALDDLAPILVSHECMTPASRSILHSGYRPQRGATSGDFFTASVTNAGRLYPAGAGRHPARVVFLVNEVGAVPDLALAMQSVGDARVVVQGSSVDTTAWTRGVDPLPGGRTAKFRTVEMERGFEADLVLPHAEEIEGGAALAVAVKLAKENGKRSATRPTRPLPPIRWAPDARYENESYPRLEHRLLALFRFWNVIRLFYPYMALLEPGAWDRVLADFVPRMVDAKNSHDYLLTVAEMAARVPDSHVRVGSSALWQILGLPLYGFEIRHIEGRPIVVRAGDAETRAGLHVGDEVLSIDGEPFESRAARARPYIAASTPWALARDADTNATGGTGHEARLRVRGGDGKERDVRLGREAGVALPPSPAPHFRVIDAGVGYVDLSTLRADEVDGMFAALARTRAIVFDMRKGPNGTLWAIAPHLNVHGIVVDTPISRPMVGTTDPYQTEARFSFLSPIASSDVPRYAGKTVLLMNEDAQSQAESTAMVFKAEDGTTFIGSQTAGADGDITWTSLPGNVFISFSGQDIRRPDGGQLQRVGLSPDVEVRPTIAGLRAGRDEVLERALAYLREGT